MARGSAPAQAETKTAYGNANSLFGPLSGGLINNATHPAGIDPTTMAQMDTAALQSGGGSTASAVGQGALRAARTRNAGGPDAAIASGVRSGGEIASKGILANRVKSADLKSHQQQEALSGLNSLFAENLGGGTNAVNANTNAVNASWDWARDLFDPILKAGSNAYGAYEGAH